MSSQFAIPAGPARPVPGREPHRKNAVGTGLETSAISRSRARASVVPLDGAPTDWFRISRGSHADPGAQEFRPRSSSRSTRRWASRLLPACSGSTSTIRPHRRIRRRVRRVEFVVPPSQPKFSWKTPRGYLATLVGASAGGALGEILILIGARAPDEKDCGADVGCAFGNVIGAAIFLLFAILAGLVLLWVGSVIGCLARAARARLPRLEDDRAVPRHPDGPLDARDAVGSSPRSPTIWWWRPNHRADPAHGRAGRPGPRGGPADPHQTHLDPLVRRRPSSGGDDGCP